MAVLTGRERVLVAGAGPAGLTAADALSAAGLPVVVLERDLQVGGLARTVEHHGYRFDVGGHRFFTREPEVEKLWREVLGDELLVRPRRSRILYRGRWFEYPLKPVQALVGLGPAEAAAVVASYARAKLRPVRPERTFVDWVTNRFGRRLFDIFFRSYTEKVWGVPCEEIGAAWAAQRIKGLSLRSALAAALRPGGPRLRTLIGEFHYPRLGPGMLWEGLARRVRERGGEVRLGHAVEGVLHDGRRVEALRVRGPGGDERLGGGAVVSTLPLRELVAALEPAAPPAVAAAAARLRYRDFLTVALVVDRADLFPDTWLYVHDPSVQVGRIQNFGNWSPALVPEPGRSCLGLEYFCFEGDALWRAPDADLVALAAGELERLGLAPRAAVVDGAVVRMRKAYPVYAPGWEDDLAAVRAHLARFENLQVVGRNGMHRYNNMDHSMLTGLLAARNLLGERHDLWQVGAEETYLEEAR
jgi:protoporphyrinogen oxidase